MITLLSELYRMLIDRGNSLLTLFETKLQICSFPKTRLNRGHFPGSFLKIPELFSVRNICLTSFLLFKFLPANNFL